MATASLTGLTIASKKGLRDWGLFEDLTPLAIFLLLVLFTWIYGAQHPLASVIGNGDQVLFTIILVLVYIKIHTALCPRAVAYGSRLACRRRSTLTLAGGLSALHQGVTTGQR